MGAVDVLKFVSLVGFAKMYNFYLKNVCSWVYVSQYKDT
jgi:hypothetical protein